MLIVGAPAENVCPLCSDLDKYKAASYCSFLKHLLIVRLVNRIVMIYISSELRNE